MVRAPVPGYEERSRVARHEAAHAVVACLGGLGPAVVDMRRIGTSNGRTLWKRPEGPEELLASIRAVLAGSVADIADGCFDGGSCTDLVTALLSAAVVASVDGQPDVSGILTREAREARRLVDENKEAIDVVSSGLLNMDGLTVTADAATRVVRCSARRPS